MTDKGQILPFPQYSLQCFRHESSVFAENPLCTRRCEKHFTFSGNLHNGSLRHILNPWLEDSKTKPHAIRERVEKQTVSCSLHYLCPCTLISAPCILHHCTLYPYPCTLHPASLHPHPCTLYPHPCTLHPWTLIPAPCIPAPCILASQIALHSFSRCSSNIHTRLMTVLKCVLFIFQNL